MRRSRGISRSMFGPPPPEQGRVSPARPGWTKPAERETKRHESGRHQMSFWSKLFGGGGGGSDSGEPKAGGPGEEYKGFTITPMTMSAGSEFQLAGRIEKEV